MYSPGFSTAADFEIGPIRPPSEAHSLLIRATRNCPWNKCRFCHTYKGQKFELRPVEDIERDIAAARAISEGIREYAWKTGNGNRLRQVAAQVYYNPGNAAVQNVALWMNAGGESAFLQDANTLIMRTPELARVIRSLREQLPSITRITSYGRANTAAKKKPEELAELREAGLSRLHMGLETGCDPLLEYMAKGVTAAGQIAGGRRIVESGISLCEYVILGLGGKTWWREHAAETARVLSEIDPAFIRVRTLAINDRMPLAELIDNGDFVRAADEEIVEEERLLIEKLECHSSFVSDHITNLLQEVEGKLPGDKERMLAAIDRFRALPPDERLRFRIGRRAGILTMLDELEDPGKRDSVEKVIAALARHGFAEINEKVIQQMTSRFI